MNTLTRRHFIGAAAVGVAGVNQVLERPVEAAEFPEAGERPTQAEGVTVLNPHARVPVSLIVDDSTCLVNLAHFGIPQFQEVQPQSYRQPWRTLPREIPDSFVRKFGEWCHEQGVKGKYSLVPYPACVGWLDRFMPGWSKQELEDSLDLIRTLMVPDWDIHPEGISHLRAIDTKTGRAFPEACDRFMENLGFSEGKSVDELADYFTYQLRILKNIGMQCEGITMPGLFGSCVRPALAQAVMESCRSLYRAEIPHYFLDGYTDDTSVAPLVQCASGLAGPDPQCVVSMLCCTDDWFGGWDGLQPGSVDRFITKDLKGGRLPEVIGRGEPAILFCHWAGIYFNGQEVGFNVFKGIVERLNAAYDHLIWMKLSEIARYWAVKELAHIEYTGTQIKIRSPFACRGFTVRVACRPGPGLRVSNEGAPAQLRRVDGTRDLDEGTWCLDDQGIVLCLDLPKGESRVELTPI